MAGDPDGPDALDFGREHQDALGAITTAQARGIDRWARDELGMPVLLLMENAGRAVAQAAKEVGRGGVVFVLAGPGNNGGDGLAAARFLAPRVRVALSAEPDPVRCPEAALQLRILRNSGIEVLAEPALLPGKPAVVVETRCSGRASRAPWRASSPAGSGGWRRAARRWSRWTSRAGCTPTPGRRSAARRRRP